MYIENTLNFVLFLLNFPTATEQNTVHALVERQLVKHPVPTGSLFLVATVELCVALLTYWEFFHAMQALNVHHYYLLSKLMSCSTNLY